MKIIKKLDIIIILLLLSMSFVPYFLYSNKNKQGSGNNIYATITIDGEIYKVINLNENKDLEFMIKTSHGNNKVVVHDGGISIVEADCNDGVCVHQGVAKKRGDMIVCLPHKLIIEIGGADNGENEQDIIAK